MLEQAIAVSQGEIKQLNNWGSHIIDHALQFIGGPVKDIWATSRLCRAPSVLSTGADRVHAKGAEVLMFSHAPGDFLSGEEILEHLSDFVSRGADIPKIVVRADSEGELIEAFRTSALLKRELSAPFVHLCVGRYARLQRYVAPPPAPRSPSGWRLTCRGHSHWLAHHGACSMS